MGRLFWSSLGHFGPPPGIGKIAKNGEKIEVSEIPWKWSRTVRYDVGTHFLITNLGKTTQKCVPTSYLTVLDYFQGISDISIFSPFLQFFQFLEGVQSAPKRSKKWVPLVENVLFGTQKHVFSSFWTNLRHNKIFHFSTPKDVFLHPSNVKSPDFDPKTSERWSKSARRLFILCSTVILDHQIDVWSISASLSTHTHILTKAKKTLLTKFCKRCVN